MQMFIHHSLRMDKSVKRFNKNEQTVKYYC